MRQSHPFVKLLKELLAVPAPGGREEAMASFVCGKLEALGYEPARDTAGNVKVALKGRKPEARKVVIAAHMDEIAMLVARVEPDGAVRVGPSGGLHPWKLGEGPVTLLGDRESVTGVLCAGSAHSLARTQRGCGWEDVRILTGLSRERLAEAGVRAGTSAVPAPEGRGPVLFGEADDPLIAAWTFDDRGGVATLLRVLEKLKQDDIQPARPTLFCFTVQEESGCHGAKLIAHEEKPEVYLAIDGCPILPYSPLDIDGRPGVWSKDATAHYDQWLLLDLCRFAREVGTELQPVVYEDAKSEASAVYDAGGVARVALMGHVRENSHGYEVARLSCFDNVFKTLTRFVEAWE